jgi:hypothetical protein
MTVRRQNCYNGQVVWTASAKTSPPVSAAKVFVVCMSARQSASITEWSMNMRPWWKVELEVDRRTLSPAAASKIGDVKIGLSARSAWMSFVGADAAPKKSITLTPADIEVHHGYSFHATPQIDVGKRQSVVILMPDCEEDCRKIVSDVFRGSRSHLQPKAFVQFMADIAVPERIVMASLDADSGRTKGFLIYDRKAAMGDQSIHLDTVVRAISTSDDDNHLPALLAAYHAQHVVDYETLISSNLRADQLPPMYMDTTVAEGMEDTHAIFCELDELAWNECFDPSLGAVPANYAHGPVGDVDLPEMISQFRRA